MSRWVSILVFGATLTLCSQAHAAGYYGPRSEYSPSVFTYAYRGLILGGLVGASGGYLRAQRHGFDSDDWRPVVYGLGIGALGGAALGLTLGFVDLADDNPGVGNILLRDMVYGAGLGALLGTITGGLIVIRTHEAENVPFAASIGAIAGAGIGLLVGVFEGRRITESPMHRYPVQRFQPSFAAVRDAGGQTVWLTGASGRF